MPLFFNHSRDPELKKMFYKLNKKTDLNEKIEKIPGAIVSAPFKNKENGQLFRSGWIYIKGKIEDYEGKRFNITNEATVVLLKKLSKEILEEKKNEGKKTEAVKKANTALAVWNVSGSKREN